MLSGQWGINVHRSSRLPCVWQGVTPWKLELDSFFWLQNEHRSFFFWFLERVGCNPPRWTMQCCTRERILKHGKTQTQVLRFQQLQWKTHLQCVFHIHHTSSCYNHKDLGGGFKYFLWSPLFGVGSTTKLCRGPRMRIACWLATMNMHGLIRESGRPRSPSCETSAKIRKNIWVDSWQRFLYVDVSENSGTPKSSIFIGFSIINHPFWGTLIFGNTHVSFP